MSLPPFHTYMGFNLERMADGEAVATLELAEHHCNKRGVAHGGVVSSLLDTALGAAVISTMPKEWWCATISLSIQFLGGVTSGKLIATGRVIRRGRRVAFANGEIRDEAGRRIASAEGSWHLWPFHPGKPERPEAEPFVVLASDGRRMRVGKILAVGRNYAEHVVEMGGHETDPPVLFTKPTSAIVHDGGAVLIPRGLGAVHHEVELVAVIGKRGRRIPENEALGHVLGYAVGLDMTLRDLQTAAKKKGEPWALSKGFDTSAPVSTVVDREKIGDGSGLEIKLEVNGEIRQSGNTSQMSRPIASLVAHASELFTLERGDLLFTGTPAGVGPVQPGDTMVATLEKVGTLTVDVRADD
jgi:uncharacterized protein (TIGR00369 family)